MKKSVIIVGSHGHGKSKTIREYLKPLLGISKNKKKFLLNNLTGYILSQSFEEGQRDWKKMVAKYSHYEYLVLAGRPENEELSFTSQVEQELVQKGFIVKKFKVEKSFSELQYEELANQIFQYLDA